METSVLPRRLALTAGCNQLINWGISFYMPGTFARAISADRGWSSPQIYLGLTLAMLVMAAVSPFVARLLARFGGQKVVMVGTLLIAASCAEMAYTRTLYGWYGAWIVAGTGMRLSLYDALFAALVNLYGQQARRTISRVTLAGGLASAVFWPLGDGLLHIMSWQDALRIYALLGLLSAVLIRTLPRQRLTENTKAIAPPLRNERRKARFMRPSSPLSPLSLTAPPPICRSLLPTLACRSPSACCGGSARRARARWRCWQVAA